MVVLSPASLLGAHDFQGADGMLLLSVIQVFIIELEVSKAVPLQAVEALGRTGIALTRS
jgi:hypothetical protein